MIKPDAMRVPRLTVEQAGLCALLEPVELDGFAWSLDALNTGLSEGEFESDIRVGSAPTIDIRSSPNGKGGGLVTEAAGNVRLRQLDLIGEGDDWTDTELVLWLDRVNADYRPMRRETHESGIPPGLLQSFVDFPYAVRFSPRRPEAGIEAASRTLAAGTYTREPPMPRRSRETRRLRFGRNIGRSLSGSWAIPPAVRTVPAVGTGRRSGRLGVGST
jgi:hypothetical protein